MNATAPTFDFETAPDWNVSTDTLLPTGNYVVTIVTAEGGRSSNQNPQIEVDCSCDQGSRKDWLVYGSPNDTKGTGVSKVATLFRLAGVQLLNTDVGPDGLISPTKIAQLVGKKVGIVVRKEKDDDKYPRIAGYCPIDAVQATAAPASGGGSGSASDLDIPFLREELPYSFEAWRAQAHA